MMDMIWMQIHTNLVMVSYAYDFTKNNNYDTLWLAGLLEWLEG
jgi:hypothetical protein